MYNFLYVLKMQQSNTHFTERLYYKEIKNYRDVIP